MFVSILRKPTTFITIKDDKMEEIQESKLEIKKPLTLEQKTLK